MIRHLRWWSVAGLVTALVLPGAVSGTTAKTTSVKTLRAYSHTVRAKAPNTLPERAAEIFEAMDGDGATLQQPLRFARGESVYLFHGRRGALCSVLAVSSQASGFCSTVLREAGGRLSVGVSVLAGQTFAWGLVGNTVRDVSATVGGTTSRGRIVNNALILDLPDGSRGTGPILLEVRTADGTTVKHRLPGIPKPPS